MTRVMLVLGTRPEAIKLAALAHELRGRDDAEVTLCSTGQHREMLRSALAAFDLTADIDLDLMQPGQHPTELIGRMLIALRGTLEEQQPDVVVVQGDTATVMAAALAGFLHGTKVAHVEAGLRTRDKRAPFPEEVNRRVTGVVADYHLPPTAQSRDNLLAERVPPETIFVTGNTVVDALFWMRDRVADRPLPAEVDPGDRRLVLVTAHRRESFGEPFRNLCHALRDVADQHEDVQLVYPVHLNPNVQKPVHEILDGNPRIRLVDPVDYPVLVGLLNRAYLVLTDSGGIQEEAGTLGTPTLILRDKTERPEVVQAGVAKLVGSDRARIAAAAAELLTDPAAHAAMARPVNVIGDGLGAQRAAEVIVTGTMTTPEFRPEVG